MRRVVLCVLWAGLVGCADSPTAPTSSGDVTIRFDALTQNNMAVSTYVEAGFGISVDDVSGWSTNTGFGHPPPFIQFRSRADRPVTGQIHVVGGQLFYFKSVEVYSSVTPIPYIITGFRNGAPAFTLRDTVPNTFGNFAVVINPRANEAIDTLAIALTNPAPPLSLPGNPMGVDNISLTR
jgi:hypothetical protein